MTDGTHRLHLALTALQAGMAGLTAEDADLEPPAVEAENVQEAILRVLRSARAAEAMADAAKAMAQDMTTRAKRFEARSERLRGIALAAMDAIGERKLTAPDMTVTLIDGRPTLFISDEAAIPPGYWKQPAPVLDRKMLADDVKAGVVVEGASLANGMPTLTVRVR